MIVEEAEKLNPPTKKSAKTDERGVKSPYRRKLLKAATVVLTAELLTGGAFWGKEQIDHLLTPSTSPTGVALPQPSPVELDKSVTEKEINKVPLAEITKNSGIVSMVKYEGPVNQTDPYGFSISFNNLTIVAVEKDDVNKGAWVALAMSGEKLLREQTGEVSTNFDGTKIDNYFYKGFTPWVYIPTWISVVQKGSNQASVGISGIENKLKVGDSMSFLAYINQYYKNYQQMNLESYELLSQNLGKPNTDRSDQTFKFVANYAITNPPQK